MKPIPLKFYTLIFFSFFACKSFSQQIIYSDYVGDDRIRNTNYVIVGNINSNILVYKHNGNDYFINIYDANTLSFKKRVSISFFPKSTMAVNFLEDSNSVKVIFVYRKRNDLYCKAVTLDENAKALTEPLLLDVAKIKAQDRQNIYSIVRSEDKSKFVLLKTVKDIYNNRIAFTALLFDNGLNLLHKSKIATSFFSKEEDIGNFIVDNAGTFAFIKEKRPDVLSYSGGYISACSLFINKVNADTFNIYPVSLAGLKLQNIGLTSDNLNDHLIVTSFYAFKIDIEGLYTAVFDIKTNNWLSTQITPLGDKIKLLAKSDSRNVNYALNNFIIKNIVLKKDGGFIIVSEEIIADYKFTLNENELNRGSSNMLYDTYKKNIDYLENTADIGTQYYSKDFTNFNKILVLGADNKGNLNWGNVIQKSQHPLFEGESAYFSYQLMIRNDLITFLFNTPVNKNWLLTRESITSEGNAINNMIFYGIPQGIFFIPSAGKQISTNDVLIPFYSKQHYYLAKISLR